MDPYEALANAVVEQAAKDYRDACFLIRWGRLASGAERMKMDCECFFTSEWFKVLTGINGEKVLEKLRKEMTA